MPSIEPRIYTHYKFVVCQDLIYIGKCKNIMQLPGFTQCVINTSDTSHIQDAFSPIASQVAMRSITGQKNVVTRARQSIAAFQVRKNDALGGAVNMRKSRLYSFLDQYVTFILPASRRNDSNIYKEKPTQTKPGLEKCLEKCLPEHQLARKPKRTDYNHSGSSFNNFPGLEAHFSVFSACGGYNCTLCALIIGGIQLGTLCTALQFPPQHSTRL